MVGVVDLEHEVGEGELQLMGPQLAVRIARREPEPRPRNNRMSRFADEPAAGSQKRRRKRGPRDFGPSRN